LGDIREAQWRPRAVHIKDIEGVNMSSIKRIYIGVGDRNATRPSGASGTIHIDDISLCVPSCIAEIDISGDFTNDCTVNFRDFCIMGAEWADRGEELLTDLNSDGKLDYRDIARLLSNWLEVELWP